MQPHVNKQLITCLTGALHLFHLVKVHCMIEICKNVECLLQKQSKAHHPRRCTHRSVKVAVINLNQLFNSVDLVLHTQMF